MFNVMIESLIIFKILWDIAWDIGKLIGKAIVGAIALIGAGIKNVIDKSEK